MTIPPISLSSSTSLIRPLTCQCRWQHINNIIIIINSINVCFLNLSQVISPLLVQKPPAVYRKQYKRQTRVYQSGLQQPPKAIYRAATITVSRQSDEYIAIVSVKYLTHH